MKRAAAFAIAGCIDTITPKQIIPSALKERGAYQVAKAMREAIRGPGTSL